MSDEDVELHCPHCGYCLTGLPEPRCPECGLAFDPEQLRAMMKRFSPTLSSATLGRLLLAPAVVQVGLAGAAAADGSGAAVSATCALVMLPTAFVLAVSAAHRATKELRPHPPLAPMTSPDRALQIMLIAILLVLQGVLGILGCAACSAVIGVLAIAP
jgi:hypothetical protein